MDFLQEKVVLITGAGHGLGRALALKFAKRGSVVIGTYRTSRQEAGAVLKILHRYNKKSAMIPLDVRNERQIHRTLETIFKKYRHIDILVNLVGNFIYKPITQTSLEEFNDVIDTNLTATFFLSQEVLKKMKKRGTGQVINFGCAGADRLNVHELTTPYYIAKMGVIALTKIFAHAFAPHGVRVNAVSPGILKTSIAKHAPPAGRFADFDDIWNAIEFLLKPASSYINGANIEVAGGWIPGVKN